MIKLTATILKFIPKAHIITMLLSYTSVLYSALNILRYLIINILAGIWPPKNSPILQYNPVRH